MDRLQLDGTLPKLSFGEVEIECILVTGGNGCLGRSIVELLLQCAPTNRSIRVLDKDPNGAEYFAQQRFKESGITVEYFCEDLRNTMALRRILNGVQCIIHTAGVVDVSMFPDEKFMWAVNCKGTMDLLDLCYHNNIEYFIYTSSVNSILPKEDLLDHEDLTEDICPTPTERLFDGYSETKCLSERMVLEANKVVLPNGCVTKTVCLRPTVFYGEHDRANIPTVIRTAKSMGGFITQMGGDADALQQTYVGNVAWAHLCALQALCRHPGITAGNSYFITDNTPVMNPVAFAKPFLEDQEFRVLPFKLPLVLVLALVTLMTFVLGLLKKYAPNFTWVSRFYWLSKAQIIMLTRRYTFSREKAVKRLDYQPCFSFEDALKRSRDYYATNKT